MAAGLDSDHCCNTLTSTRSVLYTQLLLRDCGLSDRLAGLRRHFCMAAGDAALFFMDTAAAELAKKADAVSVPHLQLLLDLGESPGWNSVHSSPADAVSKRQSVPEHMLSTLRRVCVDTAVHGRARSPCSGH